jgi:CubicO group peptidase (beta-lactamase class C family)
MDRFGSLAAAPPLFPSEAAIQRLVDEQVAKKLCPGIALVTYQHDTTRIYTAGGTGRSDLRLDGETLFEIGSITKTLTASLLADMVQRGEVKLEDPVSMHLPTTVRVPEYSGRKIRLVDLATHTSGLPGIPTNIRPQDLSNPYSDYTVDMLDDFLASYTLTREIGSEYTYSAVGLGLLGRALGHRLGMSWEAALEERILEPLDMHSTRATLTEPLISRLARGHDETGNPVPNWEMPAMPAMGALKSSANDMAKFLIANMHAASKPFGSTFAALHQPRAVMDEETRVGLAWQTGHATNRTMVWHGGGTGGYRTLIAFEPEKQMGVVVLCNAATGADKLGFHLLDPTLPLE